MRPQPVRLDPIKLISSPPENKKSRSRKRSRNNSRKPDKESKDRKTSRKTSKEHQTRKTSKKQTDRKKTRSRRKSRSMKKKLQQVDPQTRKQIINLYDYQPIKLNPPRRTVGLIDGSRVSSTRAIYQRLSPYFGQTETNRPVANLGKEKTIKELEYLDRKTRNKPILNQLIKENILVRAN